MKHYFEFEHMSHGYRAIVDELLHGETRKRAPRGQPTHEIPNATVRLNNPHLSYPTGIGRKYSNPIAAAESLSLVGGTTDPALMVSVGANFKRFLDGGVLHGAYGPRIRGQLPIVEQKLRADTDTRQAVVEIWDARYDQADWTPRDLPCTLMFVFSIYDGKLEMEAFMRSSDIWWGVAHDYPQFTALQLTMANALGIPAGPFTHHAVSLHLYERDFEAAEEMLASSVDDNFAKPCGGGLQCPDGSIQSGMDRARRLFAGEQLSDATAEESWYFQMLAGHERLVADELPSS